MTVHDGRSSSAPRFGEPRTEAAVDAAPAPAPAPEGQRHRDLSAVNVRPAIVAARARKMATMTTSDSKRRK